MAQAIGGQEGPHKAGIVMWGAPACGKTTFLAALSIALGRRDVGWKVVGADTPSTNALVNFTTKLTKDRVFPKASDLVIEQYRWRLVGERTVRRWRRLMRAEKQEVRIALDLADLGGEGYSSTLVSPPKGLIDNLVHSGGIIFLFDPVREFEEGDSFTHFFGVLSHLSQHVMENAEFVGGRLPHHLAVVITKFDEPRVLETADRLDLIQFDPDDPLDFPRVGGEDARQLFTELCRVSATGDAEMVLNSIERYFLPERTRYFVTSAIGFHVAKDTGTFDAADFQNDMVDAGGFKRIRGAVNPINVLEPLIWLGERLTSEKGT
ncbi:hypothetical protein [Actinocorallia sp. A-T 12471]|uniref:hypothetical protein n=1 Tax=Actinocorallia sp. A-T 12471 TaxID=3089813 RepID=UPI0029D151F9|nr:hypothetical protein [Actinocorallia sp. A-T 12471]MDX6739057.1 hypothetical protein [Actinocorallia sp. A-T 12471]